MHVIASVLDLLATDGNKVYLVLPKDSLHITQLKLIIKNHFTTQRLMLVQVERNFGEDSPAVPLEAYLGRYLRKENKK